jgi:protein-tyrosine phosphatase
MMRVLFVCMGNICRSPLAEGIARTRAREAGAAFTFDSAGIEDYHVGQPPDIRARTLARARDVPIDDLRARQVEVADFQRFDLILAADRRNLHALERLRPRAATAEVTLLLDWCGTQTAGEVPDPYYGGDADFEHVFALLESAIAALLRRTARA